MGENKTELLQALAIDRTPADAPRRRAMLWPKPAAGAVMLALLGAGWLMTSLPFATGRTERSAADAQSATTSARPPVVASQPGRAGLAASGYIVARRKATVAAEITGKVVEVLIEEGMMVEAGQVVARLDNVLAEHDLALAKSRVAAADAAVAAIAADLQDAERILRRACRAAIISAKLTLPRPKRGPTSCAPSWTRPRRSSRTRMSMRNAPPRCSTSTASARRSAALWSTAARSRAR